ncbi:hypothetical protein V7138_14995 [Bacillus sp. JJ1533]
MQFEIWWNRKQPELVERLKNEFEITKSVLNRITEEILIELKGVG